MATKIDEHRAIQDNMLLYEEKLKSPLRRYTDKSFTPVRYWHIKSKDTTVAKGYHDIEELLGNNSPVKFDKIDNLPLYGLETIILQLQDADQGLDSSYEGEAIILENRLKPVENDFFMIPILRDSYIFRVTSVEYDTIASTNSYKISFVLEYIDNDYARSLEKQTKREFVCRMENAGTDEKCIIEKSDDELIRKIDDMYDEIANIYMTFYYNERYNCFLGDFINGQKLYDPFLSKFITDHNLFSKKNQIDGIIMIEQFADPRRNIKYQKTLYRFFELRKMDKLSSFEYVTFKGRTNSQTAFYRWLDDSVQIVDIPKIIDPTDHYEMMGNYFQDIIRYNGPTDSIYQKLLTKFVRGEELTIRDIDLDLIDEMYNLDDANLEVFFYTPIILYVIQQIVRETLSVEKSVEDFI